jgi:hypothetical protein
MRYPGGVGRKSISITIVKCVLCSSFLLLLYQVLEKSISPACAPTNRVARRSKGGTLVVCLKDVSHVLLILKAGLVLAL